MRFSELGERLSKGSGIELLMKDLGQALAASGPSLHMLGGGNPAHIPEMEKIWHRRMQEILGDPGTLRRTLAIYDPPRGNHHTLEALAALLRREFGWPVGPENIAVTPGGQTAFFFLFNLFAGPDAAGAPGRILFPLVPEYIGYANQILSPDSIASHQPLIEETGPHRFRYHIDFDRLALGDDIRTVCVSRPTNPSGNVLSDPELHRLLALCEKADVPLIIDNAYGWPFPGILFEEVTPPWTPHTIHVMSLSKVGLPGTRTAFVVGPPEIAAAVSSMMAVSGLANGNFGQAIVTPLLEDGSLVRASREVVRPFYLAKRNAALAAVDEFFPGHVPYALHECDGAMFLWLWMRGTGRRSKATYEQLKERGVLVVPGEYFFFGSGAECTHRHECLRISFAMADQQVREGLRIIGEELAS